MNDTRHGPAAAATLPDDPMADGIAGFGRRLRAGETTAEAATATYLARIAALDGRLGAYVHIAGGRALATARAHDALLAAGTDLGPLTGVPVALKDLFAVEGMPTGAGSDVDVADLIGPEGGFVRALKRAGCVILGKLATVEFARGAAGINRRKGTPRNPWDAGAHRVPGGSSSGSAVAMAAGMTGFAVGSDTGGSVRTPAAFCGVVGHKTTKGLWPTDGLYPTCPTLDTVGTMARSAADAALVWSALSGRPVPAPRPLKGLRLGRPVNHFYDSLAPEVGACVEAALAALVEAGAVIVPIEVPEVAERVSLLDNLVGPEFIAAYGRDRFLEESAAMDPVTVARSLPGMAVKADAHARARARHRALCREFATRFADVAAWVTPTVGMTAPTVDDILDLEGGLRIEAGLGLNTHAVSFFGLCATTTPINGLTAAPLPVGLQVVCASGRDSDALGIALAVEALIGPPPLPDLTPFLA